VREAKDIVKMDDSIKTLRNYSIVPRYIKNQNKQNGTIANGKYLLFDLKFMALPKGIGSKAFAFDRSRLKVIRRNVAPCESDNWRKLVKLSLTSTK
jgi:hypothetical protein